MIYGGYITPLVGPGLDLGAVAVEQCASDAAGRHRARLTPMPFPDRQLLSWLGPWQAEFFVGWLDGADRIAGEHGLSAASASPSIRCRGSRSGSRAPPRCAAPAIPALPLRDYFDLAERQPRTPTTTNDEGLIDVKYSTMIGAAIPIEAYMQLMNEEFQPDHPLRTPAICSAPAL